MRLWKMLSQVKQCFTGTYCQSQIDTSASARLNKTLLELSICDSHVFIEVGMEVVKHFRHRVGKELFA